MANAGNMGQFGGYGNVNPYAQQPGQGMPANGGYPNPGVQNGMYNPQMGGMPNQPYVDPMQQPYGMPQGDMYYQGQPPMDRTSHHAEIRSSSIYGPKELHSPKIAEVERASAAPAAAPAMASAGMGAAQAAPGGMQSAPVMQQAAPQTTQNFQPQAAPQPQVPVMQATAAPMANAAMPAQQPMQGASFQPGIPQAAAPAKNGGATLSLILGLLSIIFGLIPPIGIVLGIIAMNVAKGYKKRGGRADRALAGKIFGTIGLIFSIGMLLFIVVCALLMFAQLGGAQMARDMLIYYNNSPLGLIHSFPLPTV